MKKHKTLSLKQLARQKRGLRKPIETSHAEHSELIPHPRAPGCLPQQLGDVLAPIKLTINKKAEIFLWHAENTSLHAEFLFSLQLLSDLELGLTKHQLIETAYKCSLSIREQVQQFRETNGAVHATQGQHGEHVVPLQFKGLGFQWDLKCPENSPEMFAKVLCQDMNLSSQEAPLIAAKLRLALKSQRTRLSSAFNEIASRLPVVRMTGTPYTLDQLEIENSIQDTIPTLPIR